MLTNAGILFIDSKFFGDVFFPIKPQGSNCIRAAMFLVWHCDLEGEHNLASPLHHVGTTCLPTTEARVVPGAVNFGGAFVWSLFGH